MIWTHDLVLNRIGFGLKAVSVTSGGPGPRTFSSPWPAMVREPPPLAELEQWLELRRDFEAAIHAKLARPSAEQIALADEAIAWPAKYCTALQRDAVWLTALCVGFDLKLEKILRARRKVADRLVSARSAAAPDVIRIYEDEAQDAAAKVTAWANTAMAAGKLKSPAKERARLKRIKQGARILFAREVREHKTVERVVTVKRADVMPGKLFNQSRVHHHRIAAIEAILAGLQRDDVKARDFS